MSEPAAVALSATVIVPTYRRPEYVRSCLVHLERLERRPEQVIVVDASPDERTREIVAGFPGVVYLRHELGPGTTPESRDLGLRNAAGDIVAFVDDDIEVSPQWLGRLLRSYDDPAVVAVGGRIVNGAPGELTRGLDRIGRLLPSGDLTGNFTGDPGRRIEVDHLIGANMSFRRSALLEVGGIHGRYPGPGLCEETDIALRQRALGRRIVFDPTAVARHNSAPYRIRGARGDLRYDFYGRRNQMDMLIRVYGPRDRVVGRYVATTFRNEWRRTKRIGKTVLGRPAEPGAARPDLHRRLTAPVGLRRTIVSIAGLAVGVPAGLRDARLDRQILDGSSASRTSTKEGSCDAS